MEQFEDEFELLWLERRKRILAADEEYRMATDGYRMTSGADWLLFGMPVVAAILVLDMSFFSSELLNWVVSAAVAVVMFGGAVFVKSLITGGRSVSEIEADIKKRCREEYDRTGTFS